MDVTFTVKEFNEQVVEFRRMFGDKKFWALPSAKREVAQKALGHAYLFLEPSTSQTDVNICAEHLSNTLTEYNRRELMLLTAGANVGE